MLEKHRWQKRYHRVIVRSAVSKIFENLINDKLFRYLESLNLVSDLQYGFRNSHSTVVLLAVVTERIDRPFNIFNAGTMLYNPTCPHHTYCTPIKQIRYFWVRSQHSLNSRFFSKNTPILEISAASHLDTTLFHGSLNILQLPQCHTTHSQPLVHSPKFAGSFCKPMSIFTPNFLPYYAVHSPLLPKIRV